MNEAHRGRKRDPATKRREYVLKKSLAILLVFAGVVTTANIIWELPFLIHKGVYSELQARKKAGMMTLYVDLPRYWSYVGFFLAIGVASAFVLRYSVKRVKSLPVVPPVAQQVAALPAVSILVRGSCKPVALPNTLLRAAREGSAESEKELLRAESRAE